jgi:hypothetical protein
MCAIVEEITLGGVAMIISAGDAAASLIKPFIGDSETEYTVFRCQLPDKPYVMEEGFLEFHVMDENGCIAIDEITHRPKTNIVHGMTFWHPVGVTPERAMEILVATGKVKCIT